MRCSQTACWPTVIQEGPYAIHDAACSADRMTLAREDICPVQLGQDLLCPLHHFLRIKERVFFAAQQQGWCV